jgi:hypothetical protein
MNQEIGMSDFFGMEASEYLEKLDGVISGSHRPETVEFVRLARALRGSAMMASQQTIADVGSALETFARALHEAKIEWDEANKQLVIRSVDDLKVLVRKISDWSDEDEAGVKALAAELTAAAGGSQKQETQDSATGLDTGTRAFIGREGAAVASALQRASQTAGSGYTTAEVADAIIEAIQPLRGIASLGDVPPLPDLLEGVERIATECKKNPDRQHGKLKEVFVAGAAAIARVAREVAATGNPEPDSEEAAEFARLLRSAIEGERAMMSIEDFYYDDNGPHIVSRGTPPDDIELDEVELVAHGEHLKLAADELEQASSGAQRSMRLQALESRLVTLAGNAGSEMASAVARVAGQFQTAIANMTEDSSTGWLATHLREAAGALADAVSDTEAAVVARLQSIGEAIAEGEQSAEPQETVQAADTDEVPEEQAEELVAAAEETRVTTQGEPAPEPEIITAAVIEEESAVPAAEPVEEVVAAVDATEGHDLAAAYTTYESMRAQLGDGSPSIEALLAGPPLIAEPAAAEPPMIEETWLEPEAETEEPVVAPVVRAEPVFQEVVAEEEVVDVLEEDQPVIETPEPVATTEEIVPIEEFLAPITDFCYSGRAAFEKALGLKTEIYVAISSGNEDGRVAGLVEEILDLIELGINSTD